jgi:hypothetical protein
MTNTKEARKRMWKPDLGGTFDAFSEHPLSKMITPYADGDTAFLENLYEKEMTRLSADGLRAVRKLCQELLKEVTKKWYQHSGREKGRNPFWIPKMNYDDYEE